MLLLIAARDCFSPPKTSICKPIGRYIYKIQFDVKHSPQSGDVMPSHFARLTRP